MKVLASLLAIASVGRSPITRPSRSVIAHAQKTAHRSRLDKQPITCPSQAVNGHAQSDHAPRPAARSKRSRKRSRKRSQHTPPYRGWCALPRVCRIELPRPRPVNPRPGNPSRSNARPAAPAATPERGNPATRPMTAAAAHTTEATA